MLALRPHRRPRRGGFGRRGRGPAAPVRSSTCRSPRDPAATTGTSSGTGSTPTVTATTPATRCSPPSRWSGSAAATSSAASGAPTTTASSPADSIGFDIDHLVPLAEAWDSGAGGGPPAPGERYANDLGDPRTLVAVTASANRSKSDQDPAEWLPALGQCRYVRQWVAVKIRWSLKVDAAEKRALLARAHGARTPRSRCGGRPACSSSSPASGTASNPRHPRRHAGPSPQFSYCYQAIAAGYGPYIRGRDPEYAWYTDSDGDGRVCES